MNNMRTMESYLSDDRIDYMANFDEGKNDDFELIATAHKHKKKISEKERASARRKKTYYKSRNRMEQLHDATGFVANPEQEGVIQGLLRSHQFRLESTVKDNPCGCSIGNKRRIDSVNDKLSELDCHNAQANVCEHIA